MLIIDFSFFFSIIYGNTLLFAYSVINRPDELKFDFVCVYFPMYYYIIFEACYTRTLLSRVFLRNWDALN